MVSRISRLVVFNVGIGASVTVSSMVKLQFKELTCFKTFYPMSMILIIVTIGISGTLHSYLIVRIYTKTPKLFPT